ncbi:MAG: putative mannose-1-phosphate guanylyltransferase /mannose-6-phosphate isomerase [Candidatus Desulfovibrio kirbyi]|uniref:Putative mannose-1-phosphate guanylyltransferase /mannose-6-phosphate isomerase n=1 Tax=Candidatus Desulfovibrio kirbyi TaxID=2696086 RepID=A0A6L2R5V6_9BACT|nr:MAG: putative mannose-1-phosphate guanylyltransferase /mannose-6-phosphate isomerase [Candidatus Desulfovibrio kirbyi]
MIRRADAVTVTICPKFGGPGDTWAAHILNEGEFEGKGRLFNRTVLKPGVGIGKHRHTNEFEVYYILKGEGLYDDNGSKVKVGAGDMTLCPDGEEHGILNTGTEDLEMIALILFAGK